MALAGLAGPYTWRIYIYCLQAARVQLSVPVQREREVTGWKCPTFCPPVAQGLLLQRLAQSVNAGLANLIHAGHTARHLVI